MNRGENRSKLALPDYGIMIPKFGYKKRFYVFQKIFVNKLYVFVHIERKANSEK